MTSPCSLTTGRLHLLSPAPEVNLTFFSATNASVNKHTDCNMKRFGTQTLCYISSRQITAPQDLFPLSAFSMVTRPPRKLKWSPISPFFMKVSDERRIVNAFGVYIGHKICHHVPATSATLLSRPVCPKDLKIKKADVLPRSRSYLVQWPWNNNFFVFLRPQCQSNLKYRQKSNFRNSSKITHVQSSLQLSVQIFSHRFSLQTFIWSLWRISTHTNLQIKKRRSHQESSDHNNGSRTMTVVAVVNTKI